MLAVQRRAVLTAATAAGVAVMLAAGSSWAVAAAPDAGHRAGGPVVVSRVSLSSQGVEGEIGACCEAAISGDGRYVAFDSSSANLVPGDTNDQADIFVRDRRTGTTSRVSVSSTGAQTPNDFSATTFQPSISADGRYVAFASNATGLVPGDTNGQYDVFVHDRWSGATSRVSVTSSGAQASGRSPEISANGRYVTFISNSPNLAPGNDGGNISAVLVHDRWTRTTGVVSVPGGGVAPASASANPAISANGRYVAFESGAPSDLPGDSTVRGAVFVRDRWAGATSRISLSTRGVAADDAAFRPAISADGRYVSFDSAATNLVPGDSNQQSDVFVRDRRAGITSRVSIASSGVQADAYASSSAISADGRYVAFTSEATNLVPGDEGPFIPDVFVRDRFTGTTIKITISPSDAGFGSGGAFSADGRHIVFSSAGWDLVPDDTNNTWDVFVRTRRG